jgi:hypothetical protein
MICVTNNLFRCRLSRFRHAARLNGCGGRESAALARHAERINGNAKQAKKNPGSALASGPGPSLAGYR